MRLLPVLVAALVIVTGGAAAAQAPPALDQALPSLDELLARVGRYVDDLRQQFVTVISDETYEQRERATFWPGKRTASAKTTMRSEMVFLSVPGSSEWLTARNVARVNGRRVGGAGRITALLADGGGDAIARVRQIRNESNRYNIGYMRRNVSDPVLALQFLAPAAQPRSVFRVEGADRIGALPAWKLSFVERHFPTMISFNNSNAAAHGQVWVDANGVVLRTRLELEDATRGFKVAMAVDYALERKLDAWLPVRMTESYSQTFEGLIPKSGPDVRAAGYDTLMTEEITATATYSNFRRFETSARVLLPR